MARRPQSYTRRAPVREPYDYVLIVCEGAKSEPSYLRALQAAYRLSNANIEITPADGTDPMSVVRYAEARMAPYDRVYCVFDRDGHANYDEAVRRVRESAAGRTGKLLAVTSWPCFELWLLLHFRYSTAAFVATGRQSSCDKAVSELKGHLPKYAKGYRSAYAETAHLLETAIEHGKRLERHCLECGAANPATKVHVLIEYLIGLKKP
jgi:hypothetical protein